MDERIAESIRRHLDSEGMLPCAAAFRVAEELGVEIVKVWSRWPWARRRMKSGSG